MHRLSSPLLRVIHEGRKTTEAAQAKGADSQLSNSKLPSHGCYGKSSSSVVVEEEIWREFTFANGEFCTYVKQPIRYSEIIGRYDKTNDTIIHQHQWQLGCRWIKRHLFGQVDDTWKHRRFPSWQNRDKLSSLRARSHPKSLTQLDNPCNSSPSRSSPCHWPSYCCCF